MSFNPTKTAAVNHSRLVIIKSILDGYDGTIPFHIYLRSCFLKHKNFGSRDRKIYSSWCFVYFRLGNALPDKDFNTRLAIAWYLVHGSEDEIFNTLNDGKMIVQQLPSPVERVNYIHELFPDFKTKDIFPFVSELSDNLSVDEYAISMLSQPRVWIRVARGKEALVKDDLESNELLYDSDSHLPQAFSFTSGVKLEVILSKQKGYFEIQDRSSQIAGDSIPAQPGEHWWDCCCGSGGKSLELFDKVPGLKITATDSRSSILKNFRERTKLYHSQLSTTVLDLAQPVNSSFFGTKFDGIIADVPCSGSGTWSRNPENLRFFNEISLQDFVKRQQTIVASTLPFLKSQGMLVYITCSVFKVENENMVDWIAAIPGVSLVSQQFINGSENRSDSMFFAVFSKT